MKDSPRIFIIDVDGVMTDGKIYCTTRGKFMKVFGPDDHDAISLLKNYIEILFVSGDHRGFKITERRIVKEMKMPLANVSTIKRLEWIKARWNPRDVIYMGDGIFDKYVFQGVGYSIATSDADMDAKRYADYVTKRRGGDRAVAEACLHILRKFFNFRLSVRGKLPSVKVSGKWQV